MSVARSPSGPEYESLPPDVADFLRTISAQPRVRSLTVDSAREAHVASAARLAGPPDEVADVADMQIDTPQGRVPARWYRPEGEGPFPIIVYFHGGGWVVGTLDTYDALCRALTNRASAVVVSIGYSLAPEHRYPAQIEEAHATVSWAVENAPQLDGDPSRVGVAGDSAGGTLAAVCAQRLRDQGVPLAFQVLVYPILDSLADKSSGSYARFAANYYLESDDLPWYWNHYLGEGADGSDPHVSPLHASDLTALPRTMLIVAGLDPLQDDNRAYGARLSSAGVPTRIAEFTTMPHGFVRFAALFEEASRALDEIGAFVHQQDR